MYFSSFVKINPPLYIWRFNIFLHLKIMQLCILSGQKIAIFASMDAQEQHIAILKKMATAGQTTMLLPGVMLKINASDVIEAGKRLEEMGIFAFDSKTNDVKIIVEVVDPVKKPTSRKKKA